MKLYVHALLLPREPHMRTPWLPECLLIDLDDLILQSQNQIFNRIFRVRMCAALLNFPFCFVCNMYALRLISRSKRVGFDCKEWVPFGSSRRASVPNDEFRQPTATAKSYGFHANRWKLNENVALRLLLCGFYSSVEELHCRDCQSV